MSTTRDYLGSLEYVDGTLESIHHAEGRVVSTNGNSTSTGLRYEYNLKDHLGNVRTVFADLNGNDKIDQTTNPATNEVLQENHHYPFGLKYDGNWAATSLGVDNRYQYNGKEFVGELALNWNDHGARWYDPAIGRWNAVDPLAESMSSHSPYVYAYDNPVIFNDPTGMSPEGPEAWNVLNDILDEEDQNKYNERKDIGKGNVIINIDDAFLDRQAMFESENSNWDYVGVYSFYQAIPWLKDYMKKYPKISNIVILSHGSEIGSIGLGGEISVENLDKYLSGTGYLNSKSKKNIQSLPWLVDNTSGWICFFGCKVGNSPLPKKMQSFLNARVADEYTIFFNTLSTGTFASEYDRTKRRIPWGQRMSVVGSQMNYRLAQNPLWIQVRRNTITPIKVDLAIQGRGAPLKFVNPE